MFHASGIILYMSQIVYYFNLKILFNNKIPLLGNMLYVNKGLQSTVMRQHHEQTIHVGTQDNAFWNVTMTA